MAVPALNSKLVERKRAAPTHCRRGHEYTDGDYKPNGERHCRRCKKDLAVERRLATGVWRPSSRPPRDYKNETNKRRERCAKDPNAAEKQKAYCRAWRKRVRSDPAFLADYRLRKREEIQRRCQEDPVYRMKLTLGRRIRRSLIAGKGSAGVFQVLGYSVDDLRAHLERQFAVGMSWDNRGQWHVDHIIPMSSFNYTTIHDPAFKACWALANLRPLWARDNMAKGDKRILLL